MSSRPADTDRRAFLLQVAATSALLATSAPLPAQATIPTRRIPSTGEALPIIGFGSSAAVMDIPKSGAGEIEGVLKRLQELGGRVVDTSPRTEDIDKIFGQILQQPGRQKLFIAAKINTLGEDKGVAQFRQSQRLFGRRTLDLIQIESLRDVALHWPHLKAWKESGEARYIGVTVSSASDHERMEAFLRKEKPDFAHVNYSVVETASEDRLLPLARERGMAVLINRPFMNGSYFKLVANRTLPAWAAEFDCKSWAQFSLKYILSHPAVTCALVETTSPGHLDENFGAAFGRLPDEATRKKMRELARQF
jgi:diketogulonate reductase-like aldo/keto reductase